MNVHEIRSQFCYACGLLLVEQGFMSEEDCPKIEDWAGLNVAELAKQYSFDKNSLERDELRRVKQIIKGLNESG